MARKSTPEAPPHAAYRFWVEGEIEPLAAIRTLLTDLTATTAQIAAHEAVRAGLRRDLGDLVLKTQPGATVTVGQTTLRWVEPTTVTAVSSEPVRQAQHQLAEALAHLNATGDVTTLIDQARAALSTLQGAWKTSVRAGYLATEPLKPAPRPAIPVAAPQRAPKPEVA
jgi:hypothetical protein